MKQIKDMTAGEIVKNHITPRNAEERKIAITKVCNNVLPKISSLLEAMDHNDCNLYIHGSFMCDGECLCTCHFRNKMYKLGSFILPTLFKKKIRRYKK